MTTITVPIFGREDATNNGGVEFIRGPELPRLNILPGHDPRNRPAIFFYFTVQFYYQLLSFALNIVRATTRCAVVGMLFS